MKKQQITDEAIKYCSHIDFSDDKNLNEKGRVKVQEWAKQDFIAGAEWMQEQLRLSNVTQRSEPFINSDLAHHLALNRATLMYELTNEIEKYQELINGG